MKSMIGLHLIDGGEIVFDTRTGQQNLAGMSEKEVRLLHREVGVLFQGAALFDSMTVQENVMYPLEMFSDMTDEEKVERARFCLERVNMPERAFGLMPSEISGGMQKRVAIARAIALNPKYLFCDEPNSGLDPQTSIVIDNLIHDITKEFNITTIINTHDMNSVMEIGEKIVYIHEGNKWWEGTKDDILLSDNPELNDFVFASAMAKRAKSVSR
jgi:phospholipid/cholesterol/gamma-HCH transport system ATP-binding protein